MKLVVGTVLCLLAGLGFAASSAQAPLAHSSATLQHPLVPFPAYYINLDSSLQRRRMMDHLWKPLVADLRRLSAIDARNSTVRHTMLPSDTDFYAQYVRPTHAASVVDSGKVSETELGVILSHLHAIRTAYNDGCEVALIMEDDVSTVLTPFWTYTPRNAVLEAQAFNPDWTIIQVRLCDRPGEPGSYGAHARTVCDCPRPFFPRCIPDSHFISLKAWVAVGARHHPHPYP